MDMSSFGGKQMVMPLGVMPTKFANQPVWDFGWKHPAVRDPKSALIHDMAVREVERFEIKGYKNDFRGDKCFLWDLYKQANKDKHLKLGRQITGSCCGMGLFQVASGINALMRVKDKKQKLVVPFWLIAYGRGRLYLGSRGPGEGSTGGVTGKAACEDGFLDSNESDLPPYKEEDGLVWGRDTEMKWSDGAKIPESILTRSRIHIVQSRVLVSTTDQLRDLLSNGYPATSASDFGGPMVPDPVGTPAIRLSRKTTVWMHQMSFHGWWDHPTEGLVFYELNNWGLGVHGSPLNGEPPGGFWRKAKDVQNSLDQKDTFAFSPFKEGFVAQDLFSWMA